MKYENLLQEAFDLDIFVQEESLRGKIKGLYSDNVIWINKQLPTHTHKYCVLAEEIGHHYRTVGNILDQSKISNRKQEKLARLWAYEKTIPLTKLIQAHEENIRNRYQLAEYLEVTEEFLEEALTRYKEKYGLAVNKNGYTICFEPLGVIRWFD